MANIKVDVRLYQDEGGIWIAEVPAIPGCGSEGQTREKAISNVKDAARLCLEVREDLGTPLLVETVTIDVAA